MDRVHLKLFLAPGHTLRTSLTIEADGRSNDIQRKGVYVKQEIWTDRVATPWGPWTPGIRAGDFVFVGGQGPIDPETGALKGETIQEQTRLTLESMKAVLDAAGASMDDVVKVQVLLTNLEDFSGMNGVYRTFFNEPYPTRITYGVALSVPGMRVEMDAIAYAPKAAPAEPERVQPGSWRTRRFSRESVSGPM